MDNTANTNRPSAWRNLPSTPARCRNEITAASQDPEPGTFSSAVRVDVPPYALRTPAGYGALMSVAFLACIQTKSRSFMSMPVSAVERRGENRSVVDDDPLARLLSARPNEEMTAADLLAWTILRRDTFGTAYWWIEWDRGKPAAVWPVRASVAYRWVPDNPVGRRATYHVMPGDGRVPAGAYFPHEIVPIKTAVTKDGIHGESLARMAAEDIGLSVNLTGFYRSMLENGNHHLGHIEIDKLKVPDPALADLKRAMQAMSGIDRAGEVPIFTAGATWHNDTQSMRDASLIEQQTWVLQQVCRATNVPPWKVYDPTGSTYAGAQKADIDYVTSTILPEVRGIEQALAPVYEAMGLRVRSLKFNMRGLMRGDDQSRAQFYRQLVYMGAMTPKQVAELEDEPSAGLLDRPYFPLNYGILGDDGDVDVFGAKAAEPGDGSQKNVKE
jgi:HK97 family phage portal protein